METKDDVGVGVKIINGNDAIEILKVMSKDTKIYEVSPILVELIIKLIFSMKGEKNEKNG